MKMIVPGVRLRRQVSDLLDRFFDTNEPEAFAEAMVLLCRFFHLAVPKVVWYEQIDGGKTIGFVHEDGKVHLTHPENFKINRKYNTLEQWRNAVLHEFGHYLFWADAEQKANQFAQHMEKDLTKPIWKEDIISGRGRVFKARTRRCG